MTKKSRKGRFLIKFSCLILIQSFTTEVWRHSNWAYGICQKNLQLHRYGLWRQNQAMDCNSTGFIGQRIRPKPFLNSQKSHTGKLSYQPKSSTVFIWFISIVINHKLQSWKLEIIFDHWKGCITVAGRNWHDWYSSNTKFDSMQRSHE